MLGGGGGGEGVGGEGAVLTEGEDVVDMEDFLRGDTGMETDY